MVDRPEPVAAGGVVGPAAGNALVAGWLGSRLAVRGVVDVVVDVGESSSEVEAVVTLKGKQFQVKIFLWGAAVHRIFYCNSSSEKCRKHF